jgi:pimeloyl-ACP methyl ester carboxylesterase
VDLECKDALPLTVDWKQAPPSGAIHGNQAMITRVDSTATLDTINVPTLVVCGSEDPITGETVMKPIKEHIKGCKYVLVEGAGNWIFVDLEFDREIRAFGTF